MASVRPDDDNLWNWLRPIHPGLLRFEPHADNLSELIVPAEWPTRVDSNLPDGSWSTKDLFIRHPTLEAYRYAGRIDDVIVLDNGEKTNPILVEGEIAKDPLVEAAVLFGQGRPALGLAVVLAQGAIGLDDEQVLGHIWPAVDVAQQSLPSYARISPDMVLILEYGTKYPRTDKGTVVRQRFYNEFSEEISGLYRVGENTKKVQLVSIEEARDFIASATAKVLRLPKDAPEETDFSDQGMDSLQATQLLNSINGYVKLHGNQLDLGVIFDKSNIQLLAAEVFRRSNQMADTDVSESTESIAMDMIQKYSSNFPERIPTLIPSTRRSVILTGATGSLGAHLLAQLAADPTVSQITCLVRADSLAVAESRVQDSLRERRLLQDILPQRPKISCIAASLSEPSLGLDKSTYNDILAEITEILHCGWPVNFNRNLGSFERDGIKGLYNLLATALKCRHATRLVLFSSIGTAMQSPSREIPEEVPTHFNHAQGTGYSQSKYVAEHICQNASSTRGLPIAIIRIGQIIGDTRFGVWNTTEATPLVIRSVKSTGCLPALEEKLEWMPVDTVARVTSEILLQQTENGVCEVFNLVNPHALDWKTEFLPILREKGLVFDSVQPSEWLRRLENSDPDPKANPTVKLAGYFARKIAGAASESERASGHWCSERTRQRSASFAAVQAPDSELVGRIVNYFDGQWDLPGIQPIQT